MNDVLMVVDVQNGLAGMPEFASFVTRINRRIEAYRQADKAVIFVQHSDADMPLHSKPWEFARSLRINKGDLVIQKTHPDSFHETKLQMVLDDNKMTNFEICGAQTEYCIDTTIRVGFHLGYQIIVQHDLVSTFNSGLMSADQINQHHEHIWQDTFAKVF